MPIYSLGPPRFARKVLTEKEFLDQMKSVQEESTQALEDLIVPESVGIKGSQKAPAGSRKVRVNKQVLKIRKHQPNYVRPGGNSQKTSPTKDLADLRLGHYEVRDMRKIKAGIEFLDLELPMGVFPSVVLIDPPQIARVPFAVVNAKRNLGNFSQWKKYNMMRSGSSASLMMPLWFYYGLMKSAMGIAGRTKSPSVVGAAEKVPQIFQQVHHNFVGWYTATTVSNDASYYSVAIVNHGLGLPASDLTGCYGALLPKLRDLIQPRSNPMAGSVINALFLEDNLEDFCSVFSWGFGEDTVFISEFPAKSGLNRPVKLNFESKLPPSTEIRYDIDPANPGYAIGVKLDLNSFKPY